MSLFKSTFFISIFTLISRITGLIREILIASFFGVSSQTDAFFVAFRIPNLLRRLFAEGAFSQAFMPVLGQVKTKNGDQATFDLAFKVLCILTALLILITVLGVFIAPYFVWLMTGGFNNDQVTYNLTVALTKFMFPYIIFISLVALSAGILNTFSEFKIPAITPVFLNLAFILFTVFISPKLNQPIWALAFAVIFGGIIQLIFQLYALSKIGFFINVKKIFKSKNKFVIFDSNVKKIISLIVPATFAVSVAQISLIINTHIASKLEVGSVSWLSYADRIMEFPTALLGVALGTVLLPNLTKAWNENNNEKVSSLIDWGLKIVFFLGIPTCCIIYSFSEPIAAVIFHYGEFSDYDLKKASEAISAYSIGIIGLISIKILAPGFYSRQDIKTPVKIAILTLIITQCLNFFFVPILGHAGLALAISIAAIFNTFLLLFTLIKRKIYQPKSDWFLFKIKVFFSSSIIFYFFSLAAKNIDWIDLQNQPILRISFLLFFLIIGFILYLAITKILGIKFKTLIYQQ